MHRGRLKQASTLLLLAIIFNGLTTIARADYSDVLENQRIDDQLRLLGPDHLLKNARILREERRQQQHHHEMVDAPCARDLAIYELAIDQRKSWALKMFDASSKLPAGMLQGHVIDIGMFDECTETHGQSDAGTEIHGRHCIYEFHPSAQHQFVVNPRLSICLPASCGAEDIVDLLHETINATAKLKTLGIEVASVRCTAVPEARVKSASTSFIVASIVAVVYVTFLVFCTICDLAKRRWQRCAEKEDDDNSSPGIMETLERMSLLKNAEEILSVASPRKNDIAVVHGLRAISICWIMMMHEYLAQFLQANVNVVDITKWFTTWKAMYPLMGVFPVDTFFALSGFLMTYNSLRQIRRTNEFNVALHYLHRLIRLTFPMVTLFVAMFVFLPRFGLSGARYDWTLDLFINGCGRKWWSVLLFMQNLVETDNYCLLHLWSLSVDMQLYLLSPFLLYPLYKRPKFGLQLLVVLIFASALAAGWIVGANKYSAIYFSHDYNVTRAMEAFQYVYQVPWTRASPWLIGILFAYVVVVECDSVAVPNKKRIFIGWILALACFAFCILGMRSFTHADYKYNLWWEATFAALQRPLWALGICWIIHASVHKAAGPISSLLSAKIFLPISRISYSIYLVHLALPLSLVATCRTPVYFNHYTTLHSYISNVIMSIVLGFFFSLMFEQPILVLEEAIFKRKRQELVASAAKVTDKAK